jgi:hypothetical protein
MNQELEALIKAYLALSETDPPPGQRARLKAEYDALVEAVLENRPGVSRDMLLVGIKRRAESFVKAQTHPSALPPQA